MSIISRKLEFLLSIPKSLYVSLKLCSFKQAMHLPIVVRYNTKILGVNGSASILGGDRIRIGFGQISEFDKKYERSIIRFNGKLVVNTPCWFGQGCRINSESNSSLKIGRNFVNTANLIISNKGNITIGNDCLVSWNTWISDTDFHKVVNMNTGESSIPNGEIHIGDKVWIGANSTVMKDSVIPNGCILGAGSLINKPFTEDNCLLAGVPAIVRKKNVSWNK